jgi:hypothetical protein
MEINYPFSGIKVQPDSFEQALSTLDTLQTGQL